jgi:hypothetical protein
MNTKKQEEDGWQEELTLYTQKVQYVPYVYNSY